MNTPKLHFNTLKIDLKKFPFSILKRHIYIHMIKYLNTNDCISPTLVSY